MRLPATKFVPRERPVARSFWRNALEQGSTSVKQRLFSTVHHQSVCELLLLGLCSLSRFEKCRYATPIFEQLMHWQDFLIAIATDEHPLKKELQRFLGEPSRKKLHASQDRAYASHPSTLRCHLHKIVWSLLRIRGRLGVYIEVCSTHLGAGGQQSEFGFESLICNQRSSAMLEPTSASVLTAKKSDLA